MAGNLSNYLENKVLDHILGTTTYTMPSTVYVALYTAAPNDTGGGTQVTGGSYARQTAVFDAASSGATQNTGNIDFTNMPACTVVAIGVFDALTTGNLLVWGTLATNKSLDAGDTLRIATGDLDISLD
jgi:hypothetical protein